jgi:protein subunit release factor A
MTAKKDLQQWVQQHRELKTVEDKQHFYQKITATLDGQTNEEHVAGLLEIKNSVNKLRVSLEQKLAPKTSPGFRVFPNSDEDRAFLQALFYRMNIPYELTA